MIDLDLIRSALGDSPLPEGEIKDLAEALHQRSRPAVRPRRQLDPEFLPFSVERIAWYDRGFFVLDNSRPAAELHYAAGDYYIQDAGSFLALALLDPQPGERICDLCSAPGGKATAILDTLGNDGWLLANESVRSRLGVLRFNLARHGATRFALSQLDPQILADSLGPVFDAVLVDAPCSGQSLLGRGKQTESAFRPGTISHCAARQERIVAAAARLVCPQGRLIYSTCTFSHAENEGQISNFLQKSPAWSLERRDAWQAWESSQLPGCYRLWPHRDSCAGAFAAVLRRSDEAPAPAAPAACLARACRGRRSELPKEFAQWGALPGKYVLEAVQQSFAWPEPLWPVLANVSDEGPEVAYRKGSTWFPSYALAMRRDSAWTANAMLPLREEDAIKYLRGESLPCVHRGWAVATWQDRPLGWLKGDGGRAKNHLPKPARLQVRTPGG